MSALQTAPPALTGPLLGLAGCLLVGLVVGALRATVAPDRQTAERLDRLRSRAGLSVRDDRLLETDEEGTAEVTVRGLGPTRRLFVSTTFLDAFDDGTAAALLAVQAGRVQVRRLPGVVGLLFLAVLCAVLPVGAAWPRAGLGDRIDRLRERAESQTE